MPNKPVVSQSPANSDSVRSPCTGICTLGPGDYCIGCLRSADEIANWLNFSTHHRDRVMEELPGRLKLLFAV